jgi:hypothetical protein
LTRRIGRRTSSLRGECDGRFYNRARGGLLARSLWNFLVAFPGRGFFCGARASVSSPIPSWNSSFYHRPALYCRVLRSNEHWQRCVDASAFAGSCGCFHAGRAAELAHCQAAFAALILVFWFFPRVRSAMIKRSSDRLALALFLILATLGSRLLGHEESPAL